MWKSKKVMNRNMSTSWSRNTVQPTDTSSWNGNNTRIFTLGRCSTTFEFWFRPQMKTLLASSRLWFHLSLSSTIILCTLLSTSLNIGWTATQHRLITFFCSSGNIHDCSLFPITYTNEGQRLEKKYKTTPTSSNMLRLPRQKQHFPNFLSNLFWSAWTARQKVANTNTLCQCRSVYRCRRIHLDYDGYK